jgi:hypothetical protein
MSIFTQYGSLVAAAWLLFIILLGLVLNRKGEGAQ